MAVVVETRSAVVVVAVLAVVLAVVLVVVVAVVAAALLSLVLVLVLVLATPPSAPTSEQEANAPYNPTRTRTHAPSSANRRRWLARTLPACSIDRSRAVG